MITYMTCWVHQSLSSFKLKRFLSLHHQGAKLWKTRWHPIWQRRSQNNCWYCFGGKYNTLIQYLIILIIQHTCLSNLESKLIYIYTLYIFHFNNSFVKKSNKEIKKKYLLVNTLYICARFFLLITFKENNIELLTIIIGLWFKF